VAKTRRCFLQASKLKIIRAFWSVLIVFGILAAFGGFGSAGAAISSQFSVNLSIRVGQQSNSQPLTAPVQSDQKNVDACALLSAPIIQSVQGEPLKQAKGSQTQNSSMVVSQCFYTLPTFTNSISLTLNLPLPGNSTRTGPRTLWQKWFHGAAGGKEHDPDIDSPQPTREEAEEKSTQPVPISGLGDEAFWVPRFVGTLYVLKGDAVFRISIGGKQDDAARLRKAQLLTKSALENLP
jgi:hypothetical protein